MTSPNYAALLDEVTTDPTGMGYAALLPGSPGRVVELLNGVSTTLPKSLMISERGIMAHYPEGPVAADAVLSKLEAFAAGVHPLASTLKRTLKFLAQPAGIDIGAPATQTMLDVLATEGAITAVEAGTLKDLARQPASRAEVLGFERVTEADLRTAGVI